VKLSELIKKRKEELGLTWADFDDAGIHCNTLSNLMNDKQGGIKPATQEKLALVLKVDKGVLQACMAEMNPLQKVVVSKKSLAKQKHPEADTVKEVMEEKPYVAPEPEPDPEEPAEVFRPEPEEEVDVMFPVETEVEETLAEFKARMKDMCLYEFTAHGNLEEAKILIAENLLEELLK
jgi:hypothetical protein